MKNVLLFLFLISNAVAFSQEIALTNEAIVGKWELFDLVNPKLTAAELAENKAFLEGTFLEFKSDKKCIVGMIVDLDGSWTLDVSKKIITTETRRGKSLWKIHSLEKDKIILSLDDAIQKVIFKRV